MKNKKGFTLIELLVVVLIIGILAAIALPQYNLAVEKTKTVEALTVLHSIVRAEQSYYLAKNAYTTSFDDLDISLPGNKVAPFEIELSSGWKIIIYSTIYVYAENKPRTNTLAFYYSNGIHTCAAKEENKIANDICESLGGKYQYNTSNSVIGNSNVYQF